MDNGGDGGRSVIDRIRSHFLECTKCRDGKVCPCRERRQFLERTAAAGSLVAALGGRDLIDVASAESDGGGGAGGQDGDDEVPAWFDTASTAEVFPQSVSSGGPTDSGVILWTRVSDAARGADDAGGGGRRLPIRVQVGADPNFERVVHDERVRPGDDGYGLDEHDGCFKYDLDGELSQNEEYFYRFQYGGVWSRTGRCRTLPGDSDVDELEFAVTNCNHWQNGYFSAFSHVADRSADFLLHLGDFIYESAGDRFCSGVPAYNDGASPAGVPPYRTLSFPEGTGTRDGDGGDKGAAKGVDAYRTLYKTYKSEAYLQRALERHTVIYTWDDHEIMNDRVWDFDEGWPEGRRELTKERYASGIQAWLEHVPARVEKDEAALERAAAGEDTDNGDPFDNVSLHDAFTLYRDLEFGDLAELLVTDERFYREPAPCNRSPLETLTNVELGHDRADLDCEIDDRGRDPHHQDRTMLGADQRQWFTDHLRDSTATWTVWMNEVLCAPLTLPSTTAPLHDTVPSAVEIYHDAWDGYIDERAAVLDAAADTNNLVALSGDMHASGEATLRDDGYDPQGDNDDAVVGTEFLVPAVTSETMFEGLSDRLPGGATVATELLERLGGDANNHVRNLDFRRHGYATVQITDDALQYTVYSVRRDLDASPGNHEVVLSRRLADGATHAEDHPGAAVTPSRRRVRPGESVTFRTDGTRSVSGPVRTYRWDFDDGETAVGETVEHTFTDPGAHEVRLRYEETALNGQTSVDTTTVQVHVVEDPVDADNHPPGVVLSRRGDGPVETGDEVPLRARLTERDGDDTEYAWLVDGRQVETGTARGDATLRYTHEFDDADTHRVGLEATDGRGATGADSLEVSVSRSEPEDDEGGGEDEDEDGGSGGGGGSSAAFSYRSLDGREDRIRAGQPVRFRVTAPTDAAAIEWSLGDGTTATGHTVEHAYDEPGAYEVALSAVTGGDGQEVTASETVRVVAADDGEGLGCEGESGDGELRAGERWTTTHRVEGAASGIEVHLRTPADTYADFDLYVTADGSTPSPASHDEAGVGVGGSEDVVVDGEFEPGDEIGVAVYATRGGGCFSVTVGERREDGPEATADITATHTDEDGTPVTLEASVSAPSGSPPAVSSYKWFYGDGATGHGERTQYEYGESGEFTVRLLVVLESGRSVETTETITVDAEPVEPTALVQFDTRGAETGVAVDESVTLDGSLSYDRGGEVVEWEWTLGDGTSATGPTVTHSYDEPGEYVVLLTVTDDDGMTDIASESVTVESGAAPDTPDETTDVPDDITDEGRVGEGTGGGGTRGSGSSSGRDSTPTSGPGSGTGTGGSESGGDAGGTDGPEIPDDIARIDRGSSVPGGGRGAGAGSGGSPGTSDEPDGQTGGAGDVVPDDIAIIGDLFGAPGDDGDGEDDADAEDDETTDSDNDGVPDDQDTRRGWGL